MVKVKTKVESGAVDIKTLRAIIDEAIQKAIMAGRRQAEQMPDDAYKDVERRLYALPDLKDKVERDKIYLEDLRLQGPAGHSTDIIRFKKSGVRLSDEEFTQVLAQDMTAKIARNEFEINTIEAALDSLKNDPYYLAITGRYFDGLHDDEIAPEIPCDPATLRRNRSRLIRRLAIKLYGVDAL